MDGRRCSFARTGIFLGLKALGLQPGDEVLVPAWHCAALVVPVAQAGFRPVFYDLDERGRLDPGRLAGAWTPQTRAVIAVHLFGFAEDLGPVRTLCAEKSAFLVEDATQAYYLCQEPVGDLVIASPYKFLGAAEGGAFWMKDAPEVPASSVKSALKDAYHLVETSFSARRAGLWNRLFGALVRARYLGKPTPFEVADAPAAPAPAPATVEDLVAKWHVEPREPAGWSARITRRAREGAGAGERRANYRWFFERAENVAELPDDAVPYMLPLHRDDPASALERLRRASVQFQRYGLPPWPEMDFAAFPNAARLARTGFQVPLHQDVDEAARQRILAALNG